MHAPLFDYGMTPIEYARYCRNIVSGTGKVRLSNENNGVEKEGTERH